MGAYSWQVIADLYAQWLEFSEAVIFGTWMIFLAHYVGNLILAEQKMLWFRRHILEFFILFLPVLRPLRLLRLVTLFGNLQKNTGRVFREKILIHTAGSTMLLMCVGALAVLDVEQTNVRGGAMRKALGFSDLESCGLGYNFLTRSIK